MTRISPTDRDHLNLRALIVEVARRSTEADPGRVADEVISELTDVQVRAALEQTLRSYVRQVLATQRAGGEVRVEASPPAVDAGQVRYPRASTRSWKRDGIRDTWRAQLEQRIHVGPESTSWRLLGECTYRDLMFAVEERRRIAERTISRAVVLEGLAKLVRDHEARVVSDLPDAVLEMQLRGEDEW